MTSFYTNVQTYGSKILLRGIENGVRVKQRVEYNPTLFLHSNKQTKYTTIHNEYVEPVKPGSIRDCKDFIKKYEDIENFNVYGYTRYEYAFISDNYKGTIDWSRKDIVVANIDIEVGSENGFPEPATATEPITAITMKVDDKFTVFGCGNFINKRTDVKYIKCINETDLIKQFLSVWTANYPDIITGWNIKFFDIPYLINRITKLLGEKVAETLSPWNIIRDRNVVIFNKEQQTYVLWGLAILDYIELYRKFAPKGTSQESYKLDYICSVEIGEKKLSYEEHGSLHKLYRDDYQKFIEYNIRDTELVGKLDDRLKLIDLALTLSYDNKCNYEDVFLQVRMWDVIIFNHFREHKMVMPQSESHSKNAAYVGAYVKEPILGIHKWVASLDLTSLYPSLVMQYNISPDTIIEPYDYTAIHKNILSQPISIETMLEKTIDTTELKRLQCSLTPNAQFFTNTKHGFLPQIIQRMFDDRVKYKKEMLSAEKELEKAQESDKHEIKNRISKFKNLQLAKKVSLNSAYGALGSPYFRFFDIRQATAITEAGQFIIRHIEIELNKYLNKVLKTANKDYVIASDTDSVYLCLDELVRQTFTKEDIADTRKVIRFMDKICENKLQPFIDKSYTELAGYTNAYAQKMFMKREALVDTAIWTGKKRYILNVYNNEGVEYKVPDIKVTGLEMVRSSTPSACRVKLKEAITIILKNDEPKIHEFVAKFKEEFKTLPLADISFPRGVNGIEKYSQAEKGTPFHVRGCIAYNTAIKKCKLEKSYPIITDGSKIRFVYLKEPNTIHSNVISFQQVLPKELDLHRYIDYDTQFEKSFIEPLRIILNCIGWKTEKVNSLEDFFT